MLTTKKNKNVGFLTYLMVAFIFVITLFGCINIYRSCKIINNQADTDFIYQARNIRQSENDYFRRAQDEVEHCKKNMEITIDGKRISEIAPKAYKYNKYKIPYIGKYSDLVISPMLLYSASHSEGIKSIYFIFDPELFNQKYVLGPWYTDFDAQNKFKLTDNGPVTDMYPTNRHGLEWYYIPKQLKKGVWSAPYVDNDLKIDMVTYSAPVYSEGKFLGIVGADVSIDAIKKFIYKFKICNSGKAYLIDKNNKVIFAKDYRPLTSTKSIDKNLNIFLNNSIVETSSKNDKITILKSASAQKLFAVAKLYNGFILVLEVPTNELYGETIRLTAHTLFLMILAVLVVVMITTWANVNIERINEELIYKEKYTRIVLDSIKDGLITVDDDFVIKSCNPALEVTWGYSLPEVIGQNLDLIMNCECNNEDKKFCLSGKNLYGIKKSGEKFPIEVEVSEINFEGKDLTLLLIRDITERKKIDKMKNEFVSTVSHELRTPLTSIKAALGLILSGVLGILPPKVNEVAVIANNNCSRLANLINDILDLEKIKAEKFEFEYEKLGINFIIEQAIILNQSYADQLGIKIKAVSSPEEFYVNTDKNAILQVMSNMISNAVKFSNIDGEVTIIPEKEGDRVKVSCIDCGIGIPEDKKYKIFQSFSQVDSSDTRTKGGTGLGLSLCKLMIERMGGEIGFVSIAQKGSTFFFILPLANGNLLPEKSI